MATTEPIRSYSEVALIYDNLTCARDRALFVLGVNTAFRGGDLLGLTVGQVAGRREGDLLRIRESKTGKTRETRLNSECVSVLAELVTERERNGAQPADALFVSHRRGTPLTIVSLSRLWKEWSARVGLVGVYGSHSGRKTKAYILRVEEKQDLAVISKFLNHSNINVTARYACIQDDEVTAMGMATMLRGG